MKLKCFRSKIAHVQYVYLLLKARFSLCLVECYDHCFCSYCTLVLTFLQFQHLKSEEETCTVWRTICLHLFGMNWKLHKISYVENMLPNRRNAILVTWVMPKCHLDYDQKYSTPDPHFNVLCCYQCCKEMLWYASKYVWSQDCWMWNGFTISFLSCIHVKCLSSCATQGLV